MLKKFLWKDAAHVTASIDSSSKISMIEESRRAPLDNCLQLFPSESELYIQRGVAISFGLGP